MLKQMIVLIIVSTLLILSMPYAHQIVQFLIDAYRYMSDILLNVFSVGKIGNVLRDLIALISVPFCIGLIPATMYWIIRRHWFPYYMEGVWMVWFFQVGAIIIQHQ